MRDLICSYYTLAGVSPAEGGSSRHPFEARVRAAAEAGYVGMGMHVRDYRALRQGGARDEDLAAILKAHGMRHVEVEFLLNWFADGEAGAQARRDEETLHHMARTFGARVLFLGGDMTPGNPMPFDELAARFSAVCRRAEDQGITIGVEPCAWTNVGDLDDALRLIEGAGARNAGVYLDVWHLCRRGLDYGRLRRLDPRQVAGVQLGDAGAVVLGSMPEDSLDHRLLPGDGMGRVAEFVAALDSIGLTAPFAVEILSIEQRARPLEEAARLSFEAARRELTRAATAPA